MVATSDNAVGEFPRDQGGDAAGSDGARDSIPQESRVEEVRRAAPLAESAVFLGQHLDRVHGRDHEGIDIRWTNRRENGFQADGLAVADFDGDLAAGNRPFVGDRIEVQAAFRVCCRRQEWDAVEGLAGGADGVADGLRVKLVAGRLMPGGVDVEGKADGPVDVAKDEATFEAKLIGEISLELRRDPNEQEVLLDLGGSPSCSAMSRRSAAVRIRSGGFTAEPGRRVLGRGRR
jgi:hypothetical protein